MSIRAVLLTLSIICIEKSFEQREVVRWLESTRVTNWGIWGEQSLCPTNTWVSGMRLKIELWQSESDDTALNAIELICKTLDGEYNGKVSSTEGPWGVYGAIKYCQNGFANGFQLRSEPLQYDGDDVAAVDLALKCVNIDGSISHITGAEFLTWGEWTQEQICPPETAICGIATQVDGNTTEKRSRKDESSLNNVDFACCKVPHPIEDCQLEIRWENIFTCQNGIGHCDVTFPMETISNEFSTLSELKFYEQLGYSANFDFVLQSIKAKAEKNGTSLESILDSSSNQDVWSFRLECAGKLQELIVVCGIYKIKSREYRCIPNEKADSVENNADSDPRSKKLLFILVVVLVIGAACIASITLLIKYRNKPILRYRQYQKNASAEVQFKTVNEQLDSQRDDSSNNF